MTPDQFCYWLQGFFELKKTIDHRDGATPETMKMIEDHLDLVFKKVTPQAKAEEMLKKLDTLDQSYLAKHPRLPEALCRIRDNPEIGSAFTC